MKHLLMKLTGMLAIAGLIALGCQDSMTNIERDNLESTTMGEMASVMVCQETAVGLTAHYINSVPSEALDITCDIGVYFDEDGSIDEVELNGTVDGAKSNQYGVYVNGAEVVTSNSSVSVAADYPHKFVSVMYVNGASGSIEDNSLTGAHRAGIVLRGVGTGVNVNGNDIVGIGPKSSGWAQNGIQIDQGASGVIKDNLIEGHFWNSDKWVSTGIGVYSDGVNVQRNTIRDNDLGVYLVGNNINLHHNTIEITPSEVDVDGLYGVFAWGGTNNGVRQNSITSNTGTGFGLWVYESNNTKLIRNKVSGWGYNLIDMGDDTKLPKPFEVD